MSFGTETPLEDFLKYIKQATTEPNYPGIPIYVDPLGLQEADKTMTSTVQLESRVFHSGGPSSSRFSRSAWCISSMMDSWSSLPRSRKIRDCDPPTNEPPPFLQKQDKLERGDMSVEEMKSFVEELKVRTEIMKQLRELKEVDDPNHGHPTGSDQVAPVLKELKELVHKLEAERAKGNKGGLQ